MSIKALLYARYSSLVYYDNGNFCISCRVTQEISRRDLLRDQNLSLIKSIWFYFILSIWCNNFDDSDGIL